MNAIQWISKEAKRMRRMHPGKHNKWSAYIADASKKYRSKSKGTATHKRKSSRVKSAVRQIKRAHSSEGRAIRKLGAVGSIAKTKARLRGQLKEKIAWTSFNMFNAKSSKVKRNLAKKLHEYKAEYNRFSK